MNHRFLLDPGFRLSERSERLLQAFHSDREERIQRRLFWLYCAFFFGGIGYFLLAGH